MTPRLLVVGAGGIGCELLKCLVLSKFTDMEIVDLDTIDVSNLNRQFLFKEEHVGMPKAKVAAEEMRKIRNCRNLTGILANIKDKERFPVDYYKSFDVVISAVDNIDARKHVNFMCILADVPMIDAGTGGYFGQVNTIKRGMYECYECTPKPSRREFAYCTIHTTPTLPVHCISWAMELFRKIGSETMPQMKENGDTEKKDIIRHIFEREFDSNIREIMELQKEKESGEKLRTVQYEKEASDITNDVKDGNILPDARIWSKGESMEKFTEALNSILEREKVGNFDKDDEIGLDFVTAASNLRAYCFSIPFSSRFQVKNISGNIIPAIATTNAIIAAVVVLEVQKIVDGEISKCNSVRLLRPSKRQLSVSARPRRMMIFSSLFSASPTCLVCSRSSLISKSASCYVSSFEEKTLGSLIEFVKNQFHFEELSFVFGSSLLYEEGDGIDDEDELLYKANAEKIISEFGICVNSRVIIDDSSQTSDFGVRSVELLLLDGKPTKEEEKDAIIPFKLVNTSQEHHVEKQKRKRGELGEEEGDSKRFRAAEDSEDEIMVV